MNMYWIALIILVPVAAAASGHGLFFSGRLDQELVNLRRVFLSVYLVVMGSEWLQGPYLYTLFKDEKMLSEPTVALLYLTGYVSAAVSALGTGLFADKYGRRTACLAFCAIHSASSLTVLSPSLPVLVLGRVLAGIALTLLWTVFESWVVTEDKTRRVRLGDLLSVVTTSNCMTAILGGVIGHCMILAFGSRMNPFLIGITLDAIAAGLMWNFWNENYGSPGLMHIEPHSVLNDEAHDKRVWLLIFISCAFEGTTFLVLYFWPILLSSAHSDHIPTGQGIPEPNNNNTIPHGVIFASFMAVMVLGAVLFQHLQARRIQSRLLLSLALLLSSLSLLGAAFLTGEFGLFSSFLLFEFCNGVYVPSIAFLRGVVVGDGNRAGVYGYMRIPLFLFVIAALLTTQGKTHRSLVLGSSAGLMVAAAAAAWWLGDLNEEEYGMGYDEVCDEEKERVLLQGGSEDYEEEVRRIIDEN